MSDTAGVPVMLIDGTPGDRLPADDRALQYGDGLFETAAVIAGRVALWPLHVRRLAEGCRRLGIAMPDPELLAAESRRLGAGSGVLKIIVTRGSGGRGYAPPDEPRPRRILSYQPPPAHPPSRWIDGVTVRVCTTRLSRQPRLAGIKHLNRLEQVLARSEWSDPEIAEGLMLADNGDVVEGTVSNLFALRGEQLITPPLTDCGVDGVMRRHVMALAAGMGMTVVERSQRLTELARCEQLFLTNSLIGIWPIRQLADRCWPVGEPVRALQRHLRRAAEAFVPDLEAA